jgi:hypothetical protein
MGLQHVDGRRWNEGGKIIGTTDEIGLRGIEAATHVHDIHATILHALG